MSKEPLFNQGLFPKIMHINILAAEIRFNLRVQIKMSDGKSTIADIWFDDLHSVGEYLVTATLAQGLKTEEVKVQSVDLETRMAVIEQIEQNAQAQRPQSPPTGFYFIPSRARAPWA